LVQAILVQGKFSVFHRILPWAASMKSEK